MPAPCLFLSAFTICRVPLRQPVLRAAIFKIENQLYACALQIATSTIPRMKNYVFHCSVVLIALSAIIAAPALSAPVGNSNWTRDYLVAADDLSRLSAGLCYDAVERDIELDGEKRTLESDRAMFYLGFSVLPWLTPYVTVGGAESSFSEKSYQESDTQVAYGGGIRLSLLDHDILDPRLMEDRIRINASLDYLKCEMDGYEKLNWNEFRTALTLGLVNDTTGNKRFIPQTIEIFAGPVYSSISGDMDAQDDFGFVMGLSLHCTERVTLDVAAEGIGDTTSIFTGVHLRL